MLIPPAKYGDPTKRAQLMSEVPERVRALPQVRSAASDSFAAHGYELRNRYYRTDKPAPAPGHMTGGDVSVIGTGYFQTMGTPILRGRDSDTRDRMGSPWVLMMNQAAARRYFPEEDPIGKRIRVQWFGGPEWEIIGIASDMRHGGLRFEAEPTVFLPNLQVPHILHAVRPCGRIVPVSNFDAPEAARTTDPPQVQKQ